MKKIFSFIRILFVSVLFLVSCSSDDPKEAIIDIDKEDSDGVESPEPVIIRSTKVIASPQRPGNNDVGKNYLINGDYMSSGVPYDAWVLATGENNSNILGRTGDNTIITYDNTAITAFNGVRVVAPNCLNCHSSFIDDRYIIGLGQHDGDYTQNRAVNVPLLTSAINSIYGAESPEAEAYGQFARSIKAIGPKTVTASRGVNPADKIAEVLISHRDKNTLEWQNEPLIAISDEVLPTDVPAWWLLKKKNAMFYNAMSRMDFCKSFIGASLLTMNGSAKAEEIDKKMEDVLAYIYSLEPPKYPFEVDSDLVNQGKVIFENNCMECHGSYNDDAENYPNLQVALESVQTDPELSNHYTESSTRNAYFLDWFNNGWFGKFSSPLEIVPEGGYIAPPLDGIWATAPYFHNGSVPTVADVLNSQNRPEFWSRTFDNTDYNRELLGWNYTIQTSQADKNTYNTTLKGYGNGGHTFGDSLSDNEITALLEYLKTI